MQLMDIHCHLIPKVDDGPSSIEEAGKLLDEMYKEGVRLVIATPHYRPGMFEAPPESILKYYSIIKKLAEKRGIRMYLGCEFYRDTVLVKTLNTRKRPLMADTDFVLVEFDPEDTFLSIRNLIYSLVMEGYRPIIAHIERYGCCRNPEQVQELRELGAHIQVNAGSVLGKHGLRMKRYTKMLIKEDLIDYIASDTHDMKYRKPNLGKCAEYVAKRYGRAYAHRIFVQNPRNIIKSRRYL